MNRRKFLGFMAAGAASLAASLAASRLGGDDDQIPADPDVQPQKDTPEVPFSFPEIHEEVDGMVREFVSALAKQFESDPDGTGEYFTETVYRALEGFVKIFNEKRYPEGFFPDPSLRRALPLVRLEALEWAKNAAEFVDSPQKEAVRRFLYEAAVLTRDTITKSYAHPPLPKNGGQTTMEV